jgi:hypothetical protein
MMKMLRGITLAILAALATSPVFAYDLNDAVNAASSMQGDSDDNSDDNSGAMIAAAPQALGLINTLGTQLNVTPQQAMGGAAAMLGMARNNLSSTDYSQLSQSVPGLDQLSGNGALGGLVGLLGNSGGSLSMLNNAMGQVKTARDMDNAFSALGMDSSMVGQFAPLILMFFGQQGVGNNLLQNLSGIWGVGD